MIPPFKSYLMNDYTHNIQCCDSEKNRFVKQFTDWMKSFERIVNKVHF